MNRQTRNKVTSFIVIEMTGSHSSLHWFEADFKMFGRTVLEAIKGRIPKNPMNAQLVENVLGSDQFSKLTRWHTVKKKTFQCQYCDKIFATKNYLKLHLRTHIGRRPFKCEFCQKDFTRKDHLKSHMMIHTETSRMLLLRQKLQLAMGSAGPRENSYRRKAISMWSLCC